jgi:hypothetical protein
MRFMRFAQTAAQGTRADCADQFRAQFLGASNDYLAGTKTIADLSDDELAARVVLPSCARGMLRISRNS